MKTAVPVLLDDKARDNYRKRNKKEYCKVIDEPQFGSLPLFYNCVEKNRIGTQRQRSRSPHTKYEATAQWKATIPNRIDLNGSFLVLWRSNCCPTTAPILPPTNAMKSRLASGMRRIPFSDAPLSHAIPANATQFSAIQAIPPQNRMYGFKLVALV